MNVAAILVVFALAAVMTRAFFTTGDRSSNDGLAFRPSAAELEQWRKETATPLQRQELVEKMQAAFAGVANVGVGDAPINGNGLHLVAPSPRLTRPAADVSSSTRLVVAVGVTSDHFWVTASYADIARGAISGAVAACVAYRVPSWLCNAAGNLLKSMASGWGAANNHGVWAAVYWWPPRVTGGRW